jgi:hypothetical protein
MRQKIQIMVKFWITILLIIFLIAAINFNQAKAVNEENTEPINIVVSITGFSAKVSLSNVIFSAELIREKAFSNNVIIGEVLEGEKIKAETTLTLPATSKFQNYNFTVNLLNNKMILFKGVGSLILENMESYWSSISYNTTAIKSESDAKLTFSLIGIIGTIKVKVSAYSNVKSLIAILTWKNETIKRAIDPQKMEFLFANLTSNIPQIPFKIKVLTDEYITIVYAEGKLQVTADNVYMPISVNQWNKQYLSGWNITFITQQYATIMELRIPSSVSSKVLAAPGSYTADFRENITQKTTEKTTEKNYLEQFFDILRDPIAIAMIIILSVLTGIVIFIKYLRRFFQKFIK